MKMKKMMFLMLTLLIMGAASMNAQVTIGSEEEPHPGAVLDLQSTKGLLLPNVSLTNVNTFGLAGDDTKAAATGMVIYNTNDATTGGQGKGLYVWDGEDNHWIFAGTPRPVAVPVTSIVVTAEGGAANVTSGGTVQFLLQITPVNATNQNVTWSIDPSSEGSGSINSTGLFIAGTEGIVKVKATSADGSGVYGLKQITVDKAAVLVSTVTVSSAGSATTLDAYQTLQLSAAIEPEEAENKTVTWSIVDGIAANVNPTTGVVTGVRVGTVTVRASATDGSGEKDDFVLSVLTGPDDDIPGEVQPFRTYCYGGTLGCWTSTNSRNTTATVPNVYNPSGDYGSLYLASDITFAGSCPAGWTVPTVAQWKEMVAYIKLGTTPAQTKATFTEASERSGYYSGSTAKYVGRGTTAGWWALDSSTASGKNYCGYWEASTGLRDGTASNDTPKWSSYRYALRCRKID